jgi:hypothetical protein
VDDLLIRAIAQASINAKDDKLRDLLTQQGVTMTAPASEPAPGGMGGAAGTDAATPAAPAAPAAPPAAAPAGKAP